MYAFETYSVKGAFMTSEDKGSPTVPMENEGRNEEAQCREDKGSPMTAPMKKERRNEVTQRATFIPPHLFPFEWSYKNFLCLR